MNGLGGLNKSPNGVVIGLVQLQLPTVVTKADLAEQTERIVWMVGKARRNLSTMDLVVFPGLDLSLWRGGLALVGVSALLYGLIWDSQ